MSDNEPRKNAKEQVKQLTDRLAEGIKELFASEKYTEYLRSLPKMYKYSPRNALLIQMQKPGATLVAGYQAWQSKYGRYVKQGERGIKILAPAPFTVKKERQRLDPLTSKPVLGLDGLPETEIVEQRIARFKATTVFDVSQTDGKPLPTLVDDLAGDVRHYELFVEALRSVSPLPIVFEALPGNTDGRCRFGERISIRSGMSEIQSFSAIIHEITHAKLHDRALQDENAAPKDKETQEVEAESVSYVVCQHYGIETGANSFGYVATWSKSRELKELSASLEVIHNTASELMNGIDAAFRGLAKERGVDLSAAAEPARATTDEQSETPLGNAAALRNYEKLEGLFPNIASGEYRYLRLEAGDGMEPLSIEYAGSERISIMHTYAMNGDLMYDPMMVFAIDREARTLTAAEYEMSMPPIYQRVGENGDGQSIDGNGTERTIRGLREQLDDFASQWFDNIGQQGYTPVRAIREIDGDDVEIVFDGAGNPLTPEIKQEEAAPVIADDSFSQKANDLMDAISEAGALIGPQERELIAQYAEHVQDMELVTDLAIEVYDAQFEYDHGHADPKLVRRIEQLKASYGAPDIGADNTPDAEAEKMQDSPDLPDEPALPDSQSETPAAIEPEPCAAFPDPSHTVAGMFEYGYTQADMLPLSAARAMELFDAGHTIYMLNADNTEELVFEHAEISSHNGLCGIVREDWLASEEYERIRREAASAESKLEASLLYGEENSFGIYQLKESTPRECRWASFDELKAAGLGVERSNYELIHTAPLTIRDTQTNLHKIFADYNTNPPEDFTGHSPSMSDVIVLQWRGAVSAHYIDRLGFEALPAFTGAEGSLEKATVLEQRVPANDTLSNLGNSAATAHAKPPALEAPPPGNSPTLAELTAKAEAGERVSVMELLQAIKREKLQPGAQASPEARAAIPNHTRGIE